MQIQTLPSSARSYSRAQLADIDDTKAEVASLWRRMGVRFDTGWMLYGPAITAAVMAGQQRVAQRAVAYVPEILEATGQTRAIAVVAETNVPALVGVTGAGYQVADSLSVSTIRAKQAVTGGAMPQQALNIAGSWLTSSVTTILADTARTAEALGTYTRPVSGYIRMVNGGACGRCVVLAGRWFRKNAGFERHPSCKCVHIPASEDVGRDWQTNPDEYFHSLTDEQQIKLMGSKANAQAVLDGADINQLVNAYRRTSGMQAAQASAIKTRRGLKFTTEGTTRRGLAAQQQAGLRRHGPQQMRLMPESIYARAKSQEDALRQLKLYGWISDDAARARGRDVFTEARRVERNARRRLRRAEAAWYTD